MKHPSIPERCFFIFKKGEMIMGKRKSSRAKRIVTMLLVFMLLFTTIFSASAFAESATVTYHGSVYSYMSNGQRPTENLHGKFSSNFGSGIVYCGEHGINTPMGDTPGAYAVLDAQVYNDNLVEKILYYGYKGPKEWNGFSSSTYNSVYQIGFTGNVSTSKTESCGIAVTSNALTRAYANEGRWYNVSGLEAFWNYINSQPSAPSGFAAYRTVTTGKQDLFTWTYNPVGTINLNKSVSVSGTGNSIAGAEYTVYSNSSLTSSVGVLTTTASGATNTLTLPVGTYYVKETSAPYGWSLDSSVHTAVVTEDNLTTVSSTEIPSYGYVKLQKKASENQDLVNQCPEQYSLAGAEYGVYKYSNLTGKVGTLTTRADGSTNVLTLNPGTYYVKETLAPEGYEKDPNIHTVVVNPAQTATVTSYEKPLFDPMTIVLNKVDAEGTNLPIEGAEFTVKYYKQLVNDTTGLIPDRTWVFKTNAIGRIQLRDSFKVGGDELYKDENGQPVGLIGTYEFTETKAPTGYAAMEGSIIRHVTKDGADSDTTIYLEPTVNEYPQTVSITVQKVDSETGERVPQGHGSFAGAIYEVTQYNALLGRDEVVGRITLDANGKGTLGDLKPGIYDVHEVKAPDGYLLNDSIVNVRAGIREINTANFDYEVESKEIVTKTEITKYETSGGIETMVVGAKLQVLDRNGNLVEEWTTTDTPHTIKGLAVGTYTLHEVSAPAGFVKAQDKTFEVKEGVETATVKMEDDYTKLEITKTDVETGDPVVGAVMQILDAGGNVKYEWTTTDTAHRIEKIPAGEYILHEVSAPDGYVVAQDKTFTVSDIGSVQSVNLADDFIKVEIEKQDISGDTPQTLAGATLQLLDRLGNIIKEWISRNVAERFDRLTPGSYILRELKTVDGYTIAEDQDIEILAKSDVQSFNVKNDTTKIEISKIDKEARINIAGCVLQILDTKGNVVKEWTTTDTPKRFDKIPLENYILHEVSAPDGYVLAEDVPFTIANTGGIQRFTMEDDFTKVEFSKTDLTTGDPVVGAELSVIPLDENGNPKLGETFETWITDDNPHMIKYLPAGKYILREKLTGQAWDYGYVTAEDVEFTVSSTPQLQRVEMKDDHTKIEISKTDINTGEFVTGTQLALIPLDEEGNAKLGEVFDTWISTDEARNLEYVPVGKYIVRETITEEVIQKGYIHAEDLIIEVKDTAEVQSFEMKDDFTKLEISKSDITNGKPVVGAEMQIKDAEGNIVKEWTTTDKPHYIEYLPVGDYVLIEKTAPLGYVVSEEVKFTVEETGEIQKVDMKDDYTKVEILKTDEKGNPLKGAKLSLLDKEGNVVVKWVTTDSPYHMERVPEGDYILHEEEAPEGYDLASDIRMHVKKVSHIQKYELKNALIPKTRDNNNLSLYVYLGLIALLTFAITMRKNMIELHMGNKKENTYEK